MEIRILTQLAVQGFIENVFMGICGQGFVNKYVNVKALALKLIYSAGFYAAG